MPDWTVWIFHDTLKSITAQKAKLGGCISVHWRDYIDCTVYLVTILIECLQFEEFSIKM